MITTLIFPLLMMCSCLSAGLQEVWEDGLAFRELSAQSRDIAEQRDGIEAERKVRFMLPPLPPGIVTLGRFAVYSCQFRPPLRFPLYLPVPVDMSAHMSAPWVTFGGNDVMSVRS